METGTGYNFGRMGNNGGNRNSISSNFGSNGSYSGTNSMKSSNFNSKGNGRGNGKGSSTRNRGKNYNDSNRKLLSDIQRAELYQFLQSLAGLEHIEHLVEKFDKHGVTAQILQNIINFQDLKDMNLPVGPRAVLRHHMSMGQ